MRIAPHAQLPHISEPLEPRRLLSFSTPENPRLQWLRGPHDAVAGQNEQIVVELVNPATSSNAASEIQLTITAAGAPDQQLGAVPLRNGKAALQHLALTIFGTYTVEASAPGLPAIVSAPFTISPAPAAKMQMTSAVYIFSGRNYGAMDVGIEVLDRFGNLETSDHSAVRVVPGPKHGLSYFRANLTSAFYSTTIFANKEGTAARVTNGLANFGINAHAGPGGIIVPVTVWIIDSDHNVPRLSFQMNAGP
jgi:hypothetical protein